MTDKLKDQASSLPPAEDGGKKIAIGKAVKGKQVIINPPEKVDTNQGGIRERFQRALQKHTVILEKKTEIVLQSKAARADLPEEVIKQVFIRGYKNLPLNTELTREQYAMNRVNSFIAGGAALQEDYDLIPITERLGMKGTGGAMRPHIKAERNVYNGRMVYHVVNAKGQVKHTAADKWAAKKHLAQKYHSYMNEEVEQIDELSKGTLGSYIKHAARDLGASRSLATDFERSSKSAKKPSMKDVNKRLSDKFKATAIKRSRGIGKAVERLTKEEVEQIDELKSSTLVSYLTKVNDDSQKHKKDPTKRSPEKANKSVIGFSRAFNKLETRKEEVEQLLEYPEDVAEGSIKDAEAVLARHGQRKVDHEEKYGPMNGADLHQHEVIRKQLLAKKRRAQQAYTKKMDQGVAEEVEESLQDTLDAFNKNRPAHAHAKIDTRTAAERKAETDKMLAARKKPTPAPSQTKSKNVTMDDIHKQIAKSYAQHKPGQYVGDSVELEGELIEAKKSAAVRWQEALQKAKKKREAEEARNAENEKRALTPQDKK